MSQEAEFPVYVYNLPVDILQQICNSLDVDKGWQDLAAKCGYHFDKVQSFDLEYQRFHGSPTRRLIFDWGVTKNATIYDLHEKLKNIRRVREMKLLEPLLIKAREHERRMAALRKAQEEARVAAASEAQGQTTPESDNKLPSSLQPQAANSPNITHSEAKEKKPSTQRSAVQDVLKQIQPDFQPDKHGYAKLNFDNNTENSRTKPTGKKQIAIPLETTRVYERCYQNERSDMERQKMNESKVENGARAGIPAEPSQSEVKGSNSDGQCKSIQSQLSMDLLLSEDEITSAMSLISLPAGQIDKDIAVAVSGTASFTYKELSQATDGFSDGNKLGEGAFGDVYLAVLKNSKCAVKKLKRVTDEPANRNAAEIKSLMRFRHENIVQLYGIAVDQGEICLVYQFMENGSLLDRLRCWGDSVPLSWEQRINILRGGACGIQYLHTMDEKCPLIHGDIKSSNILLDRHFEARVSDLGMAEYATGGQMTGMLTHVSRKDMNANTYSSRAYLPPDYFTNGPSTRSDTYGFGVIMLETCSGEEAYDERREGERFLAQYVTSLLEDQPEGEWPEQLIDKKAGPRTEQLQHLIKLALRCISHRKRDRPLMTETLKQLEWILDQWKKCSSQQVDSRAPLEMAESAWMNSQRKTSLPCQRVTAKPTPVLAKSQSLDAQPESLRLQKMYDQMQYQNNVKKLGAVLAEHPVENTQSASGQTSPAQLSQIDPIKMARLDEHIGDGSLDSDSIPTLTEENVSCFSDDRAQNQDPDHGSDNAELKAMNVFDDQGCDGSEMDEEYARRKLEEIECFDRNNISPLSQVDSSPAKQSPSSSKATENVESTTDLHTPETGNKREGEYQTAQGNPGVEMVSFFSDYETATAALYCDDSSHSQDQMVEHEDHVADGQIAQYPADPNQNEGGTTPNNGLLYCGISELNGQEVAILLDSATQQHYAVDPSTLDPLIYHQQQLQYYTECQSGLESEDKMVASTGADG